MKFFRQSSALIIAFLSTLAVHAHPGHGLLESSPAHWLSSPFHLACLGLMGGGLLLAATLSTNRLTRRFLTAAGCILLVVMAVFAA